MKILVTGAAGFIGFHTVLRLAGRGEEVVGLDNLNAYYDIELKQARLKESLEVPGYRFLEMDITDKPAIDRLFAEERFEAVVHLAAQAGVRYSIEHPYTYIESNITGFLNILEACRHYPVRHLVYASSSSVYGMNDKIPYSEADKTDTPVSLYAATKKSNELMAHAYGELYGIRNTGLRFFTVYGPWGRPDMAPYLFLKAIVDGKPIRVFNNGDMYRDFTYVDDIVTGICAVVDGESSGTNSRVYNIGNGNPVPLMNFIGAIERVAGKEAVKEFAPMQPGDVYRTYADTSALERDFGYRPTTQLQDGIDRFYAWYMNYHK